MAGLSPKGVPINLKISVFPFNYNNYEELLDIVEKNDIGVIKMEVIRNFEPKDGFLKRVRDLATKKNIVLIFYWFNCISKLIILIWKKVFFHR